MHKQIIKIIKKKSVSLKERGSRKFEMCNNLQRKTFNVLLKTRHIKLHFNGLYLAFDKVQFYHSKIMYIFYDVAILAFGKIG